MNYYNENDKHAANWLRNLIAEGLLPEGDVDERSIVDVKPADLKGYTQHHFFCGIGGWVEALRLASWPEDQPVWTGSAPCQSFSVAGQKRGFDDSRHLWPAWFNLIKECRPDVIFGEQVEAAIRYGWLDLVQDDLEGENYAFAKIVLPACGIGAPHIRQRLWFMAYRCGEGLQEFIRRWQQPQRFSKTAAIGNMGNSNGARSRWISGNEDTETGQCYPIKPSGAAGHMADCQYHGHNGAQGNESKQGSHGKNNRLFVSGSGKLWGTHGHWAKADWLYCRDEKYRAIEPGVMPLAYGVPRRMVKIRGYGNAIVPQVAAEVIKAAMEFLQFRSTKRSAYVRNYWLSRITTKNLL